jgi:hypothetical protein
MNIVLVLLRAFLVANGFSEEKKIIPFITELDSRSDEYRAISLALCYARSFTGVNFEEKDKNKFSLKKILAHELFSLYHQNEEHKTTSKYGIFNYYIDKLAVELYPKAQSEGEAISLWQKLILDAHLTGNFEEVERVVKDRLGDGGIKIIRNIKFVSTDNIFDIDTSLLLFCLYVDAYSFKSPDTINYIRKNLVNASEHL